MSIARSAVSEGAVGEGEPPVSRLKNPPKRQSVARADIVAAPEPR